MQPSEDNVYRNPTEYFLNEPESQVEERNIERDQVLSNAPQIRDAVKNLNRRADFYNSHSSISAEDRKDKEKFWHLYEAHSTVATILRSEALRLENLLSEYTEDE